jgi:hypothetical protein
VVNSGDLVNILVGGLSPTPLKNDGVKVSDDEIPNFLWKKIMLVHVYFNCWSYYPWCIWDRVRYLKNIIVDHCFNGYIDGGPLTPMS